MGFETMPEIGKKTTELEQVSRRIENTTDPELKESLFQKADSLEETLNKLEQQSGLPQEEILENYQLLSKKVAEQGIKNVLKELDENTRTEIKIEIEQGIFSKLIEVAKNKFPDKLPAIIGYTLLLFTSFNNLHAFANEEPMVPPENMTITEIKKDAAQKWFEKGIKEQCKKYGITYSENLDEMLSQIKKDKDKEDFRWYYNDEIDGVFKQDLPNMEIKRYTDSKLGEYERHELLNGKSLVIILKSGERYIIDAPERFHETKEIEGPIY